MSSHTLYDDHAVALTSDTLVLRGFTKFLGRARRIPLSNITNFRVRPRAQFDQNQLPGWGLNDDGVWYTRDRRRYRRDASIEIQFSSHEPVGFTPAHVARVRELLLKQGVTER